MALANAAATAGSAVVLWGRDARADGRPPGDAPERPAARRPPCRERVVATADPGALEPCVAILVGDPGAGDAARRPAGSQRCPDRRRW